MKVIIALSTTAVLKKVFSLLSVICTSQCLEAVHRPKVAKVPFIQTFLNVHRTEAPDHKVNIMILDQRAQSVVVIALWRIVKFFTVCNLQAKNNWKNLDNLILVRNIILE